MKIQSFCTFNWTDILAWGLLYVTGRDLVSVLVLSVKGQIKTEELRIYSIAPHNILIFAIYHGLKNKRHGCVYFCILQNIWICKDHQLTLYTIS